MHTIFETDGFILKSYPSGEANKTLEIFTQDFGLIRASAQGLRHLKSKLRYSLSDYALVRVSLVRGREFWRVTTASPYKDGHCTVNDISHEEAREAMLRIFSLLRRLLQGEEPHSDLFDLIKKVFDTLKNLDIRDVDGRLLHYVSIVEELTVLRILFLLGYVRDEPLLHDFLRGVSFDGLLILEAQKLRKDIIAEINRALKASSL